MGTLLIRVENRDGENQEGDTGVLLQGVSATYHGVYDSDETVTIFY